MNNSKFKAQFGVKPRILSYEEALAMTGHTVGDICPFTIETPQTEVYLDVSLQLFSTVFPAAGSSNSAVEMTCEEFFGFPAARDGLRCVYCDAV